MRRRRTRALLALCAALAAGSGAAAEDRALDWSRHVRLSGSASAGWFHGQRAHPLPQEAFRVWDARLFVDAELDEQVQVADATVVRNVGFTFEWDIVRVGARGVDVGELYVDLQGLGGSTWANLQVGRFQLPVGEAYLRYSRGSPDDPLISDPVGAPWFWDEGARLYGGDAHNRVGYVASISNAETSLNTSASGEPQGTLRLWWRPCDRLYLSASGLLSGAVGAEGDPASAGLWLGESWARAFGAGSGVASFVDGVEVADGPARLDRTWLVGADAIAEPLDGLRVWLAWGRHGIDSSGPSLYDREIDYWIAEVMAEGGLVADVLSPFYLALRAHGLATWDAERGYLLDVRQAGRFGYNMESIEAYTAGLGWRLGDHVVVRTEYTRQHIDLVDGVPEDLRRQASQADAAAVSVGVRF